MKVTDHLGNMFQSKKALCKYWGIEYGKFRKNLAKGMAAATKKG